MPVGITAAGETRKFGQYTLVARLAIGGMAEIFLARFSGAAGFEKLVCIKRILPQYARDPQFVSMFLAEARIASQISHPNVCSVFELGEIEGRYFIAMEYLEGVPLAAFRRREHYAPRPDPRLVAALAIQAAEGLHHAHQLKKADGTPLSVVHRDVSGGNLFATVDGVVKVLDFGIAKVQDAQVKTSTGSVKGTYAYMAPEQLRGEKLDRRTDVFALAAVTWELIARRHLFKRETDFLTFQAITTDRIPDVCEIRPDVPPELGAVLAKALSRKPDDRYATARELGQALGRAVAAIGGPLDASAVAEVIDHGFVGRLAAQRKLIALARAGGEMDLDADPVAEVSFESEFATPLPDVSVVVPEISTGTGAGAIVKSSSAVGVVGGPAGTGASTGVHGRSVVPWIVATLAIAVAGAAVIALALNAKHEVAPVAAGPPPPFKPIVVANTTPPPVDAAPPPIDAAPIEIDAAPPPPPPPIKHITEPQIQAGPPGFITIDSTPVYAVIFVDGKKLGETPLPHVSLAPGKHTVRAVSAAGSTQSATVAITSGKTAPVRRFEW